MSNISNKKSCFSEHKKNEKCCKVKSCRYWHDIKDSNNCIINKVNKNLDDNIDMTLQEIGDIFNITRMRVCQIEKCSLRKLKKVLPN